MPTPELVKHIAKAIEETLEGGAPHAVAFVAAIAYETWLAEQGFVVVPREPTPAMRKAAVSVWGTPSWRRMICVALGEPMRPLLKKSALAEE